jgi:hypothetical protein
MRQGRFFIGAATSLVAARDSKMPRHSSNSLRSLDDLAGDTSDPLISLDCYDTLCELSLTIAGISIAFTLIISLVKRLGF